MEDSPQTDPSKAGKTHEQAASIAPKSGERPDQGAAPTPDYEIPNADNPTKMEHEASADAPIHHIPAPEVANAKYLFPILAQPPEELTGLRLEGQARVAAGVTAVLKSMQFSWGEGGVNRGSKVLLAMNQKDGFDCSSCAWPDPDEHRSVAEFCENGAKASASDADDKAAGPDFFAQHSLADLSRMTDRDQNNAGRLTHPMVKRPGSDRYTRIEWLEAFQIIGRELNALDSPDEAVFYTSGKVPNEPAFLFQLFVREFGTNNLPDCSNMCHESSGSALSPTLGLGKGSVTLNDIHEAEVIIVIGQNPGTNHPRMLSALQKAKRNGAKIISVNPLIEAGLVHFKNPQDFMNPLRALGALLGDGTQITDLYLQVRVDGDMALLRGIMKHLFEAEDQNPGQVVDRPFIEEFTTGFESFEQNIRNTSWEDIESESGVSRAQLLEAANIIATKQKIITCWAMGVTQQRNGVQTIQEIVNLQLMKGAIGKPGAGTCPVRGHSNVQGDRTMGIWERVHSGFLDALEKEFKFTAPREDGYDVVEAIKAMRESKTKVYFSLGGNLLAAGPDTEMIAEGMRRQKLTVFVGTKLNRGHLVTGETSLLLPCFTHADIDMQQSGQQITSCENSMGVVSQNKGVLVPLAGEMLSEVAIISGMAIATLGDRTSTDWVGMTRNYDVIRDHISRVIPGFEKFNEKLRQPGGFYLPNGPRERKFTTKNGKANFSTTQLEKHTLEPGQLVLMTVRSHDQFNTTIYEYNDRYRGIHNERRVLFMNERDMAERGLKAKDLIDITSHFENEQRTVEKFVAVPYDIPKGNVCAYFPEANPLVPISSVAKVSNTPTSKYVVVTVVPATISKGTSEKAMAREAVEA
ncbi:oxidoreductase alpha (molybdopterin) subunit [Hymenobacter roseosalivarius DSM 11622]|uniref:Oxidoreductase alpha (Molybdopterin) subunit n=1 Tax=Hymenobacter roseosalivarius DSM 11622 TaxID=645990 RepID=A0A1W1UUR9_9BACT|nr:FdhF/YdeP family oxidoreductase [Hymenobacter roseosalivarius]SMB84739.1 oxidoreductase alpha (molybdopterin) subunit [Hymenobacter roseosalivarius DSM 11622]